ncbi:hypothetical protein [Allorhodopirellula heiligendammensis]|uniref:Uncharacterized protein n=1 Tax=Allorhodopirellula heiligendammensis TaxID=2714739 RepID=A0A5C6BXW9_9BACT|nr:hypothetical protein [Allorhodopirellula heiligendammensis]TWU16507.1 hypothetical protein Poly21_37120 [Allorhodopirellula heiligendammensis]
MDKTSIDTQKLGRLEGASFDCWEKVDELSQQGSSHVRRYREDYSLCSVEVKSHPQEFSFNRAKLISFPLQAPNGAGWVASAAVYFQGQPSTDVSLITLMPQGSDRSIDNRRS